MKMFVLQNPDYTNLYWCTEYGWVDLDVADKFVGTELDKDYCIELTRKGRWVQVDIEDTDYGSWAF